MRATARAVTISNGHERPLSAKSSPRPFGRNEPHLKLKSSASSGVIDPLLIMWESRCHIQLRERGSSWVGCRKPAARYPVRRWVGFHQPCKWVLDRIIKMQLEIDFVFFGDGGEINLSFPWPTVRVKIPVRWLLFDDHNGNEVQANGHKILLVLCLHHKIWKFWIYW